MKKRCIICGKEFDAIGNQKCCSIECSKTNRKNLDKKKHELYKEIKPKIKKICIGCGKEFETINDNQKYCSSLCAKSHRQYKVVCVNCGKEFIAGQKKAKYCSYECKFEWEKKTGMLKRFTKFCEYCGKEYKTSVKDQKYCSVKCQHEAQSQKAKNSSKNKAVCLYCGKEFIGRKDRTNKFCSRECFYNYLGIKKQNIPKFKSHISDVHHIRKAKKMNVKYEHIDPLEIFERDNWICGICGEKIDKNLSYPHPMSASLDHIIPFSKGGTHTKDNVRATHLKCNIIRGNNLTKEDKIKFTQLKVVVKNER